MIITAIIKNKASGFTLIELLITLFITMLLTLMSYHSFSTFFSKQAQTHDTLRLFHLLQFARTEAIKRNQKIILCGTTDYTQCNNHNYDWSSGIIVLSSTLSPQVLRIEKNSRFSIIHSGKLPFIQFAGDGRALSRGTLTIQNPEQEQGTKRIVIYDSGRIRIES